MGMLQHAIYGDVATTRAVGGWVRNNRFWSSTASASPEAEATSEVLCFPTVYPLTLVSEVAVKTYRQEANYSWFALTIQVFNVDPGPVRHAIYTVAGYDATI
jgi:hypothetical protein